MAPRKKQSQKNEDILDLAQSIGMTRLSDAKYVEVDDFLPTMIPWLDYTLGGGIPFGRVKNL